MGNSHCDILLPWVFSPSPDKEQPELEQMPSFTLDKWHIFSKFPLGMNTVNSPLLWKLIFRTSLKRWKESGKKDTIEQRHKLRLKGRPRSRAHGPSFLSPNKLSTAFLWGERMCNLSYFTALGRYSDPHLSNDTVHLKIFFLANPKLTGRDRNDYWTLNEDQQESPEWCFTNDMLVRCETTLCQE